MFSSLLRPRSGTRTRVPAVYRWTTDRSALWEQRAHVQRLLWRIIIFNKMIHNNNNKNDDFYSAVTWRKAITRALNRITRTNRLYHQPRTRPEAVFLVLFVKLTFITNRYSQPVFIGRYLFAWRWWLRRRDVIDRGKNTNEDAQLTRRCNSTTLRPVALFDAST